MKDPFTASEGGSLGPYRIEELIARGGMGEVYRAYDPRLERWVAIKQIRPESSGRDDLRGRLRREARAIAGLSHDAIVRLFDFVEKDDGDWIVMELVAGPTVHDLIQGGPLDIEQVLTLGRDVSSGLAAAHGAGVLHRDLKAENVVVTEEGRAKILDFGLAKRIVGGLEETLLSIEGEVLGTGRSMSPEQALGLELGPASDLFSLGTLLYEMATGVSPFYAPTPVRTLMRVCESQQLPASSVEGAVPEGLSDLIDRLLSKDAGDRPPSARAVTVELDHLAGEGGSLHPENRSGVPLFVPRGAAPQPTAPSSDPLPQAAGADSPAPGPWTESGQRRPTSADDTAQSPRPLRWLPAAAVAVALGLALWFLVFVRGGTGGQNQEQPAAVGLAVEDRAVAALPPARGRQEPATEPIRIAVLPFANHGPGGEGFFAAGITDELTHQLAQMRNLGVIAGRSVARLSTEEQDSISVGRTLGADYLLEGGVTWPDRGETGRIQVRSSLIRVADGEVVWSNVLSRPPDGALGFQQDIATRVAERLGLQLLHRETARLDRGGTTVPAAYYAYLRGLEYAHRVVITEDDCRRAADLFKGALEADPTFTRAWIELAQVQAATYFNYDRTETARREVRASLDRARALDPNSVDLRIATAYYLYRVEADYEGAIAAFTSAAEDLPHHGEVLRGIGLVHRRQGREHLEPAAEALTQAFALDRGNAELALNVAETLRAMRRYGEAEPWFETSLELVPDQPWVWERRAENLMAWGCAGDPGGPPCSTGPARRLLAASPVAEDPETGYAWIHLDLLDGRWSEALERLRRVQSESMPQEIRLFYFREVVHTLQRSDLGREAQEVAERQRSALEVAVEAGDVSLLRAQLGLANAYLERWPEALRHAETAAAQGSGDYYSGPRREEILAAVEAKAGRLDRAIGRLERLMELRYQWAITPVDLHRDPAWDPLRGTLRFERLLTKYPIRDPAFGLPR